MSSTKKISAAKTTCDGLHRLVRKLNVAAVDLDKSGGSAYELMALLASTHACVNSLSSQLDDLAGEENGLSSRHEQNKPGNETITPLHRNGKPGIHQTAVVQPDTADSGEDSKSTPGTSFGAIARQ
jgi:ABC-type transporter Mla subunit MlaD